MSSAIAKEEIYAEIVSLIQNKDPRGAELLYETFHKGMRYVGARHCPEFFDDVIQDTLVTVLTQVANGALRVPEALPGYINMILKRTAWNKNVESRKSGGVGSDIYKVVINTNSDPSRNPEESVIFAERVGIMKTNLLTMRPIDRELLTRFYLENQSPAQICREMNLTTTQFRLRKTRAKELLHEITTASTKREHGPIGFFKSLIGK
jgi:DNA-directed RNA polymerase specialized sigma24 family protein